MSTPPPAVCRFPRQSEQPKISQIWASIPVFLITFPKFGQPNPARSKFPAPAPIRIANISGYTRIENIPGISTRVNQPNHPDTIKFLNNNSPSPPRRPARTEKIRKSTHEHGKPTNAARTAIPNPQRGEAVKQQICCIAGRTRAADNKCVTPASYRPADGGKTAPQDLRRHSGRPVRPGNRERRGKHGSPPPHPGDPSLSSDWPRHGSGGPYRADPSAAPRTPHRPPRRAALSRPGLGSGTGSGTGTGTGKGNGNGNGKGNKPVAPLARNRPGATACCLKPAKPHRKNSTPPRAARTHPGTPPRPAAGKIHGS